jgi:GNAT superfamily N-acetyltransferase
LHPNASIALPIVPLAARHIDPCEALARRLPAWFGVEEGLRALRASLQGEDGYVALDAEAVTGFVTIDRPFPETWEIAWMAVAPDRHRQGIGRALVATVDAAARASGAKLLHVKTLAATHPSAEYARTRAFYRAMGFLPLAVEPEVWDPANPCLLMVKPLAPR